MNVKHVYAYLALSEYAMCYKLHILKKLKKSLLTVVFDMMTMIICIALNRYHGYICISLYIKIICTDMSTEICKYIHANVV